MTECYMNILHDYILTCRYRESSTICKDVCVLSAIGTAVNLSPSRTPRSFQRERGGGDGFNNDGRRRASGREHERAHSSPWTGASTPSFGPSSRGLGTGRSESTERLESMGTPFDGSSSRGGGTGTERNNTFGQSCCSMFHVPGGAVQFPFFLLLSLFLFLSLFSLSHSPSFLFLFLNSPSPFLSHVHSFPFSRFFIFIFIFSY